MATLPRTSKLTHGSQALPVSFAPSTRPASTFDAGLNSSAAWTEHQHQHSGSLSDEEREPEYIEQDANGAPTSRLAEVLFEFTGKPEFREIVKAEPGQEIEVLKEDVGEGWSLVKLDGEMGLLPQSYYSFTNNLSPDKSPTATHIKDTSSDSVTPRNTIIYDTDSTTQTLPVVPQTTGEWQNPFPSFRRSLLGGKSLNRFSSFVTSGAEEFVLKGVPAAAQINVEVQPHGREATDASIASLSGNDSQLLEKLGQGEADKHFVDIGPAWMGKVPPFRVMVHSPERRTTTLGAAYTVYSITSLFGTSPSLISPESSLDNSDGNDATPTQPLGPANTPAHITVHRRFSHFILLHTALTRRLPGIALPPLPEKQYAGRFNADFVEARRSDLERYLGRLIRHPVIRYAEVVTFFLGCENDKEWSEKLPYYLSLPVAGPSFYANVYHPAFNVDAEEAKEAGDRFEVHVRAVGRGVQALRNMFSQVREARVEMSKAEKTLALTFLGLITSKSLAAAPLTGITEEDEDTELSFNASHKGLMNGEGAWCWRENCEECLRLTKAMQKTAETLYTVGDAFDDHARRRQLATHESLKNVAHPSSVYEPVITTHRSTLIRYQDAIDSNQADEEMAARCETVLNTTMAELDTYHSQKIEDFRSIVSEHLDGEIAFYEQVIARLHHARTNFSDPLYTALSSSPRQPSHLEREREAETLRPCPLPQPCPHVFDSAPMRPVSAAIHEGVGILLGKGERRSVFGNFWTK